MSVETLGVELRGLMMMMRAADCDVLVLTSWWRRWRKTERWAIAQRNRPRKSNEFDTADVYFVDTGERLSIYQAGKCSAVDDPERWPDDVCAAVARLKLSQ